MIHFMSKCSVFNTLFRYIDKPLENTLLDIDSNCKLFNTFNDQKGTPVQSTDILTIQQIGLHVCYRLPCDISSVHLQRDAIPIK